MLSIFSKHTHSAGSILYRGNLAPRPEEYSFLQKQGVQLKLRKAVDAAHWGMEASHPAWGDAHIVCLKKARVPPGLVRWTAGLTDEERVAAEGSEVTVTVGVPAKHKTVLKDRKRMLRWARAVMADDGLVFLDHQSMLGWGRGRLDDELMHDADLDIEALYAVHAVTDERSKDMDNPDVVWMHTHGLGEMGAFDFDIIRPHSDVASNRGADLLRAMAFSILEGEIKPNEASFRIGRPGLHIRMVPVGDFVSQASSVDLKDRDDPHGDHAKQRSVVCEPGAKKFFGLGGSAVTPSRALRKPLPEQGVFRFTGKATALMAERARQTIHLLPQIMQELAVFKPHVGAKIGYPTDGGGPCEHMWFEVHSVGRDGIDSTLSVAPFRVSRMKLGDRGMHPLEQLTDWMVALPFGMITPRNLGAWRMAKEHGAKLLEILELTKAAE